MRYLAIALTLILGLSACNMTTANQPEEQLSSETIVQPTNSPVAAKTATPTTSPTQKPVSENSAPVQNLVAVTLPNCTVRSDWQTFTVAAGDTLGQIAQLTGTDASTLAAANCLSDANAISVGQVLRVPFLPASLPNTTPVTSLRIVGDFAGRPRLESCWASNPGTNPLVYDAIDGNVIATLSNRVPVVSATSTWVQVHLNGTMTIPESQGWMRISDVSLIGFCTEATGVQLSSFRGFYFGNPAGIPNGICVVAINNAQSARAYETPNGELIGELNGWAKWVSTEGHFYQFQQDSVAGLNGPGPYYAWVDASQTSLYGC